MTWLFVFVNVLFFSMSRLPFFILFFISFLKASISFLIVKNMFGSATLLKQTSFVRSAPLGGTKGTEGFQKTLKPLVRQRHGTYEVSLKSELFGTKVPGSDAPAGNRTTASACPTRRAAGGTINIRFVLTAFDRTHCLTGQPNSRFELETFCLQNRRTANCANLAMSFSFQRLRLRY